jgi:hypothetical protein
MTEEVKPPYQKLYGLNMGKRGPDYTRCCEEVSAYVGNWPQFSQCSRPRGHGPDSAYCKQHDPEVVKARRAKADAKSNIAYQKQRLEWAGPRFFRVLQEIANGHNDPRSIASLAIEGYETPNAKDAS